MQSTFINRADPEIMVGYFLNGESSALTAGYPVCLDATEGDGVTIAKPATENLGLFLGVVQRTLGIAAADYGPIACYASKIDVPVIGHASLAVGDILKPTDGEFHLVRDSAGDGTDGKAMALEAYTVTTTAAAMKVFIAAM